MEFSFSHRLCRIIRRHRKIRGLSLTKLADKVHKTKATLSKYENGHAVMDLNTFGAIAEMLNIKASQLILEADGLYGNAGEQITPPDTEEADNHHYMYFYDGREKKLKKSLLFTSPPEDGVSKISLYYMLQQFEAPESCTVLYTGDVEQRNDFMIYTLENKNNTTEKMFITAKEPFQKRGVMSGIMMGISFQTIEPISFKVLISDRPLAENEKLSEILKISKENITALRDINGFTVHAVTEEFD